MNSDRRKFVFDLMVSSTALRVGMVSPLFVAGCSSLRKSSSHGGASKKIVSIFQAGAPNRWSFDLFLNPYGQNDVDLSQNPCVANGFRERSGRLTDPVYELNMDQKYRLHLPPLWSTMVPISNGRKTPATDVLENMLTIQGIHTGNGAHFMSQRGHFWDRELNIGLCDTLGEKKTTATGFSFLERVDRSSRSKLTYLQNPAAENQNIAEGLLSPFVAYPGHSRHELEKDLALELSSHLGNSQNVIQSVRAFSDQIRDLNLQSIWEERFQKYDRLIQRSLAESTTQFKNLTEMPVGKKGGRGSFYSFGGSSVTIGHDDLRTAFNPKICRPGYMAAHFAFAEILLEYNLTNYVSLAPEEFSNLINESGNPTGPKSHNFDEHVTGVVPATLINNLYFHCLLTCLVEFTANLKSKKLFEDTVMVVGSEFNRSPRPDGSGSDHGWNAKNCTLISGMIKKGPLIIGDIKKSNSTAYPGFWGEGAKNRLVSGEEFGHLTNLNLLATISSLVDGNLSAQHSLIRRNPETMQWESRLQNFRVQI